MRRNVLAVRCLEQVLDALRQEELAVLQIAGIARLEVAVFRKGLLGQVVAVVVANGNRRALEQDFTLLADFDVNTLDGDTDTADGKGFA